ncbi:hypothetical protein [Parabacteroides sp. ZJ-118]|uniref:hypothetical protein n=1 Tax=Parabacteroides sp. ZJ-118 TaxID=2709398 RepID=UPI0013E9CF64|nr:hypothetical protein [Parabacteroides sp. ZJ-118]
MRRKFLFKLVALMMIFWVVGCSNDVGVVGNDGVGVGPKGKLHFSGSKSWEDRGVLIYENFDPSYIVIYLYRVNADSVSLCPSHSSNLNDLKTYPFEKDLNKFILSLEDTDRHAVYKPQ